MDERASIEQPPAAVINRLGLAQLRWTSLGSAGGFSGARFWRSESPSGPVCLRRWPAEHPTPQRLGFMHDVLFFAESNGFRSLPLPMRAVDGASFVGFRNQLWQAEPWQPGKADFVEAPSVEKARSALRTLARFHRAVSLHPSRRLGRPPAIQERLERMRDLQQDLPRWREATPRSGPEFAVAALGEFVHLAGLAAPAVTTGLESLFREPRTLHPAIRDIWSDHVLFSDGDVRLVDFGALRVDWPLADAARLLGSLDEGRDVHWEAGVAAYAQESEGSDVATLNRELRGLDRANALLAPYHWLKWLIFEGRTFEDLQRVRQRLDGAIDRLRRLI